MQAAGRLKADAENFCSGNPAHEGNERDQIVDGFREVPVKEIVV